jgi:uroporphyrinogen-III synthase
MFLPRVIVTRPQPEAAHWVRDLRARGFAAEAIPLICIQPVTNADARAALQQARERLDQYRVAMFVSGNAVRYFFQQPFSTGLPGIPLLDAGRSMRTVRAWVTGPGTARALLEIGCPLEQIDVPDVTAGQQADSEALWARVQTQIWPGVPVLMVRGGDAAGCPIGRAWLADQLTAAGAQIETVVAYWRRPPFLFGGRRKRIHRAATQDGSVWLISSSEAVTNLLTIMHTAMPDLDLQNAYAITTHPRIAYAARVAGFGMVAESAGPTLDAVIRSIESFA